MNKLNLIVGSALLALLAACQGKAPSTPATPATPDDSGALARMVGSAMDKARAEMEKSNIDISNVAVKFVDSERQTPVQPKAEITPQGDLLIEGAAVEISPVQRALLLQYRDEILAVAGAGMDIGKQGVGIAGKAVNTAIAGIFNGDTDKAERELEAESSRIEAAARMICGKLQPMLDTQQRLAVALPAFKPYANLTQADIDDCMSDTEGGIAASNR